MMHVGPGWRLWVASLLSVVLGVVLSVYASVRIAESNTRDQLRLVQTAKAVAGEEQHRAACQLVSGILAAYEETPPPTVAGKNVADAWRDEYRILQCLPTK